MNLRELYTDELFGIVYERLQEPRAGGPNRTLVTQIQGPEVISDDFLRDWLTYNYLGAMDFRRRGRVMMGEIGGIIFPNPRDSKRVLAVSDSSRTKVNYGFRCIKEAERRRDKGILSELELELESPIERRQGITVVNGVGNVSQYDFTTSVARENELDGLYTHLGLMISDSEYELVSDKLLENEQYIFNIPVNERIFRMLRRLRRRTPTETIEALKGERNQLIPKGFIAGFHFIYEGNLVRFRPIVNESAVEGYEDFLRKEGFELVDSDIGYIGRFEPWS